MLCPVGAVHTYVARTRGFRRSDELIVSWVGPHKSRPVTKQHLSHWLVEAIASGFSALWGSAHSFYSGIAHFVGLLLGEWTCRKSVLQQAGHRRSLCPVLQAGHVRTICHMDSPSALIWSGSCRIGWWTQDKLSGTSGATISQYPIVRHPVKYYERELVSPNSPSCLGKREEGAYSE